MTRPRGDDDLLTPLNFLSLFLSVREGPLSFLLLLLLRLQLAWLIDSDPLRERPASLPWPRAPPSRRLCLSQQMDALPRSARLNDTRWNGELLKLRQGVLAISSTVLKCSQMAAQN